MNKKELLRKWNYYFNAHLRKGESWSQIRYDLIAKHGYKASDIEKLIYHYRKEKEKLKRMDTAVFISVFLIILIIPFFLPKPTITGMAIGEIKEVNTSCLEECLINNQTIWTQFPLKNSWQKNNGLLGGEGMQMVWDIDWNPSNTNILYLVTDTTRVWKSTDRGFSWIQVGNNLPVKGGSSIVSDPDNADAILVAASKMGDSTLSGSAEGIYLSNNGGLNWTLVGGNNNFSRTKHGKTFLFNPDTFNGTKSTTIYAGSQAGLLKSINGGNSWGVANNLSGQEVYDLEWANSSHSQIYISTNISLYKFEVSNNSTIILGQGLPGIPYDLVVSNSNPDVVFVASTNGIYKSINGGVNFSSISSGLNTSASYAHITLDKINESIMYTSPHNLGGLFPYYSTDGGASWNSISHTNSGQFLQVGSYSSEPIIADPDNALIAITQRDSSIAKTYDGGNSWNYSSEGYIGARLSDIDFVNETTSLFCLMDYGLFSSTDNGSSFSDLDLPRVGGVHSCGAVDALNNGTIITSSGTYNSQDILKSNDWGGSWSTVLDASEFFDFIRYNPNNNSIVYAGEYVSKDGGNSWSSVGNGYEIRAIDLLNSSIIYGIKDLGNTCRVAKSTDNGATWTQVGGDLSTSDVFDLDVDPFNSTEHILVAGGYNGVYEYKDNGWNLRNDNYGLPQGGANYVFVRFDPRLKGIAWTGQQGYRYHGTGIYLSINGGTNWTNQIKNLGPYNDIFDIQISPYDSLVYLTGPGVWTTSLEKTCNACFFNETSNETNTSIISCTLENKIWNENENQTNIYNLSACFIDPLNQTLDFGVTGNNSIIISISSQGIVNLSVLSEWTGVEYIIFIATAGNRSASTNNITLTVNALPFCGDGSCNGDETCSSCSSDCGACAPSGGGGGGGGSATTDEDWNCGNWSSCVDGKQSQICNHKTRDAQKTNTRSCVIDTSSGSHSSTSTSSSNELKENLTEANISVEKATGAEETLSAAENATKEPVEQNPGVIITKPKANVKGVILFGVMAVIIAGIFIYGVVFDFKSISSIKKRSSYAGLK